MDAFLSKYLTKGTFLGILSVLGMIATAFGKPGLAAVFTNPDLAAQIVTVLSGAAALYAGVAKGIHTAPAA